MPDGFLLKSVVFKLISKEISRAEHEYMNIHPPPPPPINALGTAWLTTSVSTTLFTVDERTIVNCCKMIEQASTRLMKHA